VYTGRALNLLEFLILMFSGDGIVGPSVLPELRYAAFGLWKTSSAKLDEG